MKNCPNCGNVCNDADTFCTVCGATLGSAAPETKDPASDAQGQDFKDKAYDAFVNTPDTTAEYSPEDISANKIFAVLAYFGILFIVPLLAAPNSRFAKFHANQGLVLFIAGLILGVIFAIPILGWIVGAIGEIATLILAIMGIVNAAQGQAKELPIIGKFKIIK